jgi:hypothetical protein
MPAKGHPVAAEVKGRTRGVVGARRLGVVSGISVAAVVVSVVIGGVVDGIVSVSGGGVVVSGINVTGVIVGVVIDGVVVVIVDIDSAA